jgi:hypothetical protein
MAALCLPGHSLEGFAMRRAKAIAIAPTHNPLIAFFMWATLFVITASASLVATAIYVH